MSTIGHILVALILCQFEVAGELLWLSLAEMWSSLVLIPVARWNYLRAKWKYRRAEKKLRAVKRQIAIAEGATGGSVHVDFGPATAVLLHGKERRIQRGRD
jgi:hypothetical protein